MHMDKVAGNHFSHVHVYTSYLTTLRDHWAYKHTNRLPGRKKDRAIYWKDATRDSNHFAHEGSVKIGVEKRSVPTL